MRCGFLDQTIDLVGLNTHELALNTSLRAALWAGSDLGALDGILQHWDVGYVVLFPRALPGLVGQPAFQAGFVPLITFRSPVYVASSSPAQDTLTVYRRLRAAGPAAP